MQSVLPSSALSLSNKVTKHVSNRQVVSWEDSFSGFFRCWCHSQYFVKISQLSHWLSVRQTSTRLRKQKSHIKREQTRLGWPWENMSTTGVYSLEVVATMPDHTAKCHHMEILQGDWPAIKLLPKTAYWLGETQRCPHWQSVTCFWGWLLISWLVSSLKPNIHTGSYRHQVGIGKFLSWQYFQ